MLLRGPVLCKRKRCFVARERWGLALPLGCQGGGHTDREMEVASLDKTETESASKKGPSASLQLQRAPGSRGRCQQSWGPWNRRGASLLHITHPPRWQSSQRRLGSSPRRTESKVLFLLILNMPAPQNGGSESETMLLKIRFYSLPT